ncbi:neurogenic locus Notch protein-like isoform X4 [Strongylocentrotus purpuratus]|uniref:Uncharacterized protein n=1 Tax=Strongylocentrotus purpuratus TaxID=7668 RepID=A0A7M7P9C7_STRPU|nr:neurogenic locus Notch protein-like isoform X4 [Strongylocentrotus purpuratus]
MAGNVMTLLSFMIGAFSFLVFCQVQNSNAYPTGAVISACGDMTPNHGFSAQTSVSPYSITVSSAFYQPGQQMTVTISTNTGSLALKGILLQARRTGTDQIIGTWSLLGTTGFQTLACSGANSAVTHTSNADKPAAFQFRWTPPDVNGDDIYMTATFVQTMPVFWVAERTSNIQLETCNANGAKLCGANGNCESLIGGGINCVCEEGYTGILCTMGPCDSDPCVNGGTCTYSAGDTTFTCSCPPPLGGPTCQTVQDLCNGNLCENEAGCTSAPGANPPYTCQCQAGFSGFFCGTDNCITNNDWICNNGTCETIQGGGIRCNCFEGFTGTVCDQKSTTTTPCNPDPCKNEGVCAIRGDTWYTCTCPATYVGTNCDIPAPCNPSLCENGGTCTVTDVESYSCACPPLYTGINCQTSVTSSGDTFPPVVSNCPSDIVRTVPAGTVALMVSWVEPTANDNVGVQTFESSVPSGTNFPADTTTNVQYTATDFSGNSDTSCSFTVRVTTEADITPPTVEGCPTDIVHTVTPGTSSRPVTWNEPTATDDGSGLESFTSSATSGTNFPADTTTTVVYRAVDNAGNEDRSCEFTVRIITSSNGADTVPPIITNCPADIVITALPGQQGVEASWIAPSASDSSGVLSLTPNIPSGTTFSVGFTATIVYTATDNLGNTDDTTCRFTITILSSSGPSVDTTPPTVNNCPLDFTINANAEEQVAPVTWSSPTAFDASGVASITSIPVSGSLLPVGEATIVTFSVADNVGNIDISCRFVATVAASSSADTTLPTITGCPGDITDTALPGDNTLSVTWDEPQASDASGIQSFTPNIQSGFNFPTGRTINVVYTAVDNAGNIQRCGFTVTVNAASDPCTSSPCQNDGTCLPSGTGFVCMCPISHTGRLCDVPIVNPCSSTPCQSGGQCNAADDFSSFTCQCVLPYTGTTCNQSPCDSNPCLNGGACGITATGYMCNCPPTHTGERCGDIAPCGLSPCKNNGICTNDGSTFSCSCPDPFTGLTCVETKQDCRTATACQNDGNCLINQGTGVYQCVCPVNAMGEFCEILTPDCTNSLPCQNGGTCALVLTSYQCQCTPLFEGDQCGLDITDCRSPDNSCVNGGTCMLQSGIYACVCPEFFQLPRCIVELTGCLRDPCQNGGTCAFNQNGDLVCECPGGYAGPQCESAITCESSPCQNGGTCFESGFGAGYICQCPTNFTGLVCETEKCTPSTCQNGGTCIDDTTGFNCQCPAGYSGDRCDTPDSASPCDSSPCGGNGATCLEDGNSQSYICICPPGRSPPNCDGQVQTCSSSPCQNGGTCSGDANGYTCQCPVGYNGVNCQNPVQTCSSSPCQNGGTCSGDANGYTCQCPVGYNGVNCQNPACDSSPCQNDGTCSGDANGYTCQCPVGFDGVNCENTVLPCESSPCLNGATCHNLADVLKDLPYSCMCAPGFNGPSCENVLNCSSSPCQNGGMCMEEANGYTCQCPSMYTGTNCEVVLPCESSSPCLNGATCQNIEDVMNNLPYTCMCAPGFDGPICDNESVTCDDDPCEPGGTCIPLDVLNQLGLFYTCFCPDKSSGPNCTVLTTPASTTTVTTTTPTPTTTSPTTPSTELNRTTPTTEPTTPTTMLTTSATPELSTPNDTTCLNGMNCVNGMCLNAKCDCDDGYEGDYCESEIDLCGLDNPCMNNGDCITTLGSYACNCQNGFTGLRCTIGTDPNDTFTDDLLLPVWWIVIIAVIALLIVILLFIVACTCNLSSPKGDKEPLA